MFAPLFDGDRGAVVADFAEASGIPRNLPRVPEDPQSGEQDALRAVADGAHRGDMIDRALSEGAVRKQERMGVEGHERLDWAGAGIDGDNAVTGLE